MTHLIVRVGLRGPPELLHRVRTPGVAESLFEREEGRLRPDQGVRLLKVNPLHWPEPMDQFMAEAWTREYGACLRAGALKNLKSAFGREYAFKESA